MIYKSIVQVTEEEYESLNFDFNKIREIMANDVSKLIAEDIIDSIEVECKGRAIMHPELIVFKGEIEIELK